jgi:hypothetical protein
LPHGLPGYVWRGLLARGTLLEARANLLGRFSDLAQSGSTVLRDALSSLHVSATAAAATARSDQATIDQAETHWQARLEELLQLPLGPEERELLDDLRSQPANHAGGDPFRTLYDAIVEHAAKLYGGTWPARTPPLRLFSLEAHPRQGSSDPYALTAQTVGPRSRQAVELQIQAHGLGPATFIVMPVVLVHECVCHVVPLAMDHKPNNESPFAEGFMDWAASYHLRRWLPLLCPLMAKDVYIHETRLATYALPRETGRSSPRTVGRSAAGSLVTQLVNGCGLELPDAETRVAALALNMNISSGSGDARDIVVQEINLGDLTIKDPRLKAVILDKEAADQLF